MAFALGPSNRLSSTLISLDFAAPHTVRQVGHLHGLDGVLATPRELNADRLEGRTGFLASDAKRAVRDAAAGHAVDADHRLLLRPVRRLEQNSLDADVRGRVDAEHVRPTRIETNGHPRDLPVDCQVLLLDVQRLPDVVYAHRQAHASADAI